MYQYGTSARKLTEYDSNKKQNKPKKAKKKRATSKNKKIEIETKMARFNFVLILLVSLICLLIVMYRNVKINEAFSEVQSLQKEVSTLEKENSQISVNIQNSLNLSNIESAAMSTLGMQKLSNKQTVYISLDTKDYVEVSNKTNNNKKENFISNIWNKFLDLF